MAPCCLLLQHAVPASQAASQGGLAVPPSHPKPYTMYMQASVSGVEQWPGEESLAVS